MNGIVRTAVEPSRGAARLSRALGRLRLGAALWASVLLFAGIAVPAEAAVVTGLYTVTVDVDPQAANPRAASIETAMRRLLVRLTGDRRAADDESLAPIAANAERFLDLYASLERGAKAEVTFLRSEVDRQLAALNRPVWGDERPLTLIWLALDGGDGERVLLSADGASDIVTPETSELIATVLDEIRSVAEERALPVTFPLLDLEDRARVTSADVWGRFLDIVQPASQRYGADAVVVGQVVTTPFGTSVNWGLARGTEQRTFAGGSVAEAVHWLADTFAQDFSVSGDQQVIRLIVQDVDSFDDYGSVMSHLESLSIVQAVDIEAYDGGILTLRATARGDAALLERTLALGRLLTPDPAAASLDNTLVLRIVGGPMR